MSGSLREHRIRKGAHLIRTFAALAASPAFDADGGSPGQTLILAALLAAAVWSGLRLFRGSLFISRPNEILVVSGKNHQLPSGEDSNFTVIQAEVLSNGGIPLDVHAIANVKITKPSKP